MVRFAAPRRALAAAVGAALAGGALGEGAAPAGAAGHCPAGGAPGRCLAQSAVASDQPSEGSLALLQQNARAAEGKLDQAAGADEPAAAEGAASAGAAARPAGEFPGVNVDALWNQLSGAVSIDSVKEKMSDAANSGLFNSLKGQLSELQEQFPLADTIKAQFQDQWDSITDSVSLDKLTSMMSSAKDKGLPDAEKLEAKVKELQAKLPGLDVGEVKAKAAKAWGELEDKGFPLPNLDALEEHAKKAFGKAKALAKQMASDALDEAKDKAKDLLGKFKGKLGGFFR